MTDEPISRDAKDRYRRRFVLVVTVALVAVFLLMLKDLLVGVISGILLWWLTHGLYRRLLVFFKGRKGLAAGLSVAATFVLIVVPVLVIFTLIAVDAGTLMIRFQEWYAPLRPTIESRLDQLTHGRTAMIFGYEVGGPQIAKLMEQLSAALGNFAVKALAQTVNGIATGLLMLLVTLYTLYFFYLDGLNFVEWLKRVLPLTREQSNIVLRDFFLTCKSTLKSLIIIGLIQGTAGGIGMWAVGIPAPIFWSLVMAIASVIPSFGPQIILMPACVVLILTGNLWAGIGLFVWSILVVSTIDNILRPFVVARDIQLHELLILLSTLGGIAVFGFFGFIIGPAIVSLLRAVLRMYIEIYGQPPEPPPEIEPASVISK